MAMLPNLLQGRSRRWRAVGVLLGESSLVAQGDVVVRMADVGTMLCHFPCIQLLSSSTHVSVGFPLARMSDRMRKT